MVECPNCGHNIFQSVDSDEKYAQEDQFTTVVETYYVCDNCSCEFKKIETTTIKIEITKEGKEDE